MTKTEFFKWLAVNSAIAAVVALLVIHARKSAEVPAPTKPTTYTVETRCVNNVLEARLKENNEGFTKWFPDKTARCEVSAEKPLNPTEALRVKLQTPGTCPAHCICPTTKQLDVCLVMRGMCERDRNYYKNVAEGKAGCGQVFDCVDSLRESQEVITRGERASE